MDVTDEVKQRIDLVDFISRYTPLKKTGSTYKGLCPFHSERTPSFVVFPHTATWRCFGACGIGGDIFSFLMQKENLDFREALEILAREAGVELQQAAGGSNRRETLYEINQKAAEYFQQILHTHRAAQEARTYLQRRGINSDVAQQFQLGFALNEWSALRDYLDAQGYSLETQIEAGLVKHNEERDSTYDAFRDRVIIPIRDRQARIIGFGGRILGDGQPKYLNTAETPIFHKSHVIYGLDTAYPAIRESDQVVVVEGYMDVIAAHQFGFDNVVACMGTALTSDQLQQLQRFTTNYVLALDADSAGQQATIRGLNQARQALDRVRKPTPTRDGLRLEERLGANLYICSMPEGRDPDDVIRQDPDEWRTLITQAKPLVDFYFDVVSQQVDLTSARGKGAAVAELAPLIAELDDEIEREHYVQRLSRIVQIDELTIVGRVQAAAKTNRVSRRVHGNAKENNRNPGRFGIQRSPLPEPPPDPAELDIGLESNSSLAPVAPISESRDNLRSEDYLLAHLLQEPDLLVWLCNAAEEQKIENPRASDWQHVENQELFRALKSFMTRDEQWDLETFQDSLTGHLHGRLGKLIAIGAQLPPCADEELRRGVLKSLVRMRIEQIRLETTHIRYLMDEAQRSGDQESIGSFTITISRNIRELDHLQSAFQRLSRVLFSQGRSEQGVKLEKPASAV